MIDLLILLLACTFIGCLSLSTHLKVYSLKYLNKKKL